ncbi:MAG: sulfotransferase domain-containing protein [Aquificae bacterium]|nr:sulfotransferase domain-containing protein [Aquificota bacterium]
MKIIPMANALPKSGTNLLQKLFELMGYKYDRLGIAESLILGKIYPMRQLIRGAKFDKNPLHIGFYSPVAVSSRWLLRRIKRVKRGGYISGHANYSERLNYILEKYKVKVVHIIRDPRDVLVSHAHFFAKKKDYFLYPLFSNLSFEDRIKITLNGGFYEEIGLHLNSFSYALENVLMWKKSNNCLIVKFEDLIGEKGGGSKEKQMETIESILIFLKRKDLLNEIEELADKLYGGTHTFRKGKKETWKEELSTKLKKEIHDSIGNLIIELGYEI